MNATKRGMNDGVPPVLLVVKRGFQFGYSTYPDRRFSSRYHNILKMSPPFASSEGVSASGDRYQSDDA